MNGGGIPPKYKNILKNINALYKVTMADDILTNDILVIDYKKGKSAPSIITDKDSITYNGTRYHNEGDRVKITMGIIKSSIQVNDDLVEKVFISCSKIKGCINDTYIDMCHINHDSERESYGLPLNGIFNDIDSGKTNFIFQFKDGDGNLIDIVKIEKFNIVIHVKKIVKGLNFK